MPARALASLIGKIVAMSPALGPVTRLMTRSLYAMLNSRRSWCQQVVLSPEAREELLFWQRQIGSFNGQSIRPSPSVIRVVYSDASSTGYGGYYVEHGCLSPAGNGRSRKLSRVPHGVNSRQSGWCLNHLPRSCTIKGCVGLQTIKMLLEFCCMGVRNHSCR